MPEINKCCECGKDLIEFDIGTDTTAADPTDTALGSEILRVSRLSSDKSVADTITVTAEIEETQANGSTIGETGWNGEDEFLVDGCDATTDWTDSADMTTTLNNTTFFEGTGSLDMTKDGAGSATASSDKTTTSRDFTDSSLSIVINILDASTLAKLAVSSAFSIRFGSDNSNYYQWDIDRSELSVGKNLVTGLTSSNADSTTGTPVITAMDYTYIAFTATGAAIVWAAGDILMDYIKIFGGTQRTRDTMTALNKTDDIRVFLTTSAKITVTQS